MSAVMYPEIKPKKLYYGFSTISEKWVVMESKPYFLKNITVFEPKKTAIKKRKNESKKKT